MDFKATYRFTNMPLGIHIEEKGRFIANGHNTLYKLMTARCSSRKTYLHVYIQIRQGQHFQARGHSFSLYGPTLSRLIWLTIGFTQLCY